MKTALADLKFQLSVVLNAFNGANHFYNSQHLKCPPSCLPLETGTTPDELDYVCP